MSHSQHTSAHTPAAVKAPSTLHVPQPGLQDEWASQNHLGLTPEQAGVMDLLEGRVIRAPLPQPSDAHAASMQRDVVLALVGGVCLVSGLVAVFFMAALGAVLLTIGALFCVAAYEHAVAIDGQAVMAHKRSQSTMGELESDDAVVPTQTLL